MKMKSNIILCIILTLSVLCFTKTFSQALTGVKGDPIAISDLKSMVNSMGGLNIWKQLKSVHFVHRWYFWDRDSYLENEILDLTGPRS